MFLLTLGNSIDTRDATIIIIIITILCIFTGLVSILLCLDMNKSWKYAKPFLLLSFNSVYSIESFAI